MIRKETHATTVEMNVEFYNTVFSKLILQKVAIVAAVKCLMARKRKAGNDDNGLE